MESSRATVILLACIALLIGLTCAPVARAAGTVVGSTTLTSNSPAVDEFGANLPVFQGAALNNYVLTAPLNGMLASWSFRSGGVPPGSSYELAVLEPQDNTGTAWRLVAVSAPESVTSTAGDDELMGPFTLSPGIAITAGDSVALLPVAGTSDVPIETGVIGQDGIRQFPSPFGGLGSSENIVPSSAMNNGQIVPIQATIAAPLAVPSPPSFTVGPRISGTPSDGHPLFCSLGTWNSNPTVTNTWMVTSESLQAGAGKLGPLLKPVTTVVGSEVNYVVPDLSPGDQITCAVTATNAGGSVTVDTAPVSVAALRPVLAPPGAAITHSHFSSHPQITPGVGVGGTNHCSAGVWLHHPTKYAFAWYRRAGAARVVARTSSYSPIDADIGRSLYCAVTASNSAGSSAAAKSRSYVVPRTSPKSTQQPSLSVSVQPKPSSLVKPSQMVDGNSFALRCGPGRWNLPNLTFSYQLVFDGAGTVKRTQKPRLAGLVLPLPGRTATIRVHIESNGVPIEEQPFLIIESTLAGPQIDDSVQCEVTAQAPNGLTGTALSPATMLAGPV